LRSALAPGLIPPSMYPVTFGRGNGSGDRPRNKDRHARSHSEKTHGYFTHYYAAEWKPCLIGFIQTLGTTAAAR